MNDSKMPRRDFLMLAWQAMGGLAAAATGLIGWRFLASRASQSSFGGIVIAGSLEDFPVGTVTAFPTAQFYLVRLQDGGLLALYRKCTHLNCVVLWNAREERFTCPCHGSQFEVNGDLINPPAPRPLVRFPLTLEGGIIKVDTGTLIERKQISPQDAVYPPAGTL